MRLWTSSALKPMREQVRATCLDSVWLLIACSVDVLEHLQVLEILADNAMSYLCYLRSHSPHLFVSGER